MNIQGWRGANSLELCAPHARTLIPKANKIAPLKYLAEPGMKAVSGWRLVKGLNSTRQSTSFCASTCH